MDFKDRRHYAEAVNRRFAGKTLLVQNLTPSVAAALEATLSILIEEGYPALSMRSIAKRAGISLGTLTYHFSGKAQLIAMCLDLFVDSEINSLTKLANFSDEPEIALEAAIRNQVELTLHPYARRFDFEYWAYAEHDASARNHLNSLMTRLRQMTAKLIMDARPGLPSELALRKATLIQTLIEGMTVIQPLDEEQIEELGLEDFYEDAIQTCLMIATT